jgi:hypothetical protein
MNEQGDISKLLSGLSKFLHPRDYIYSLRVNTQPLAAQKIILDE